MTKILASSKLEKFDLNGELDELTPQITNGLYKKFNFEGTISNYINLEESKILVLQKNDNGDAKSLLESKCKVDYKNIKDDANFFTNLSIDDVKIYDLIIYDSHAWSVPLNDLKKSIELSNYGIPCLLIGNDTIEECYGSKPKGLSVTSDSDIAKSYIIKENIPFSLDDYSYTNLPDYCNYPTDMANDKMFPILKCKEFYPMIAYESPCNTISICDNTAGFFRNQPFFFKIVEWLISTKNLVKYKDYCLFGDGIVCQKPFKNLWSRYKNGIFSSSPANGNWNIEYYFPYETINSFNESPRIIKCSPKKGMNYYTIKSSSDLQHYPDSEYPTGTKYRISCWAYVEKNCDMSEQYVKIIGEFPTDGESVGYDFNKKGTWQYLSTVVTSTSPGFYFLLYANRGTENVWTKGNVYFSEIVASKVERNEDFRFIDYNNSSQNSFLLIKNLESSEEFTLIYEYKQLINYVGTFSEYYNLEILQMIPKDESKPLTIYDYYYPSDVQGGKSAAWVAFDNYVDSKKDFWHLHQDYESYRKKDDNAFIVVTKTREHFQWHIVNNGIIYSTRVVDISDYPEISDFKINKVSISSEHGGLAKSLSIYNRALTLEEIKVLTKDKKYMSISLDGNLRTNNLSEKEWIPEDCFYSSLAEDSVNNIIINRRDKDFIFKDNWIFSGYQNNYINKNCLKDSNSSVTIEYDENENEYTIHVPKDDNLIWYEKGATLKNMPVDGNERYIMSFDFYCDTDLYLAIDLNHTAEGIEGNDNHVVIKDNMTRKQSGGKYKKLFIMYDLLNNAPIFSCSNTFYIVNHEEIPKEGVTFKIKNISLFKIKGGKKADIKNFSYPCTNLNSYDKNIKFNLNGDIGLEWNKPWTLCYWKIPISGNKGDYDTERYGYIIDSIGCNNNSVGTGYCWIGKTVGNNIFSITGRVGETFEPEEFFFKPHLCVLKYDGEKITYNAYLENKRKISMVQYMNITTPNKFVTQYGYDLCLGGWDDIYISQAYYKDLIIAQRIISDEEIEKILKTRIIDKPNNTNISNLLNEGGI